LSPCLINEALCHEGVWGSGAIAPPFLISILDGGEWSASHPDHVTPQKGHWYPLDRLDGPQSQSGSCGEEKNYFPCQNLTPAVQPVVHTLSLYRLSYSGFYSNKSSSKYLLSRLFLVFLLFLRKNEMGRACSTNGEKRNTYRILVGKPERKGALGRPRRMWVRQGPVEGSCEHGNETSGSIKRREVLEWQHNLLFLKKGSAPLLALQHCAGFGLLHGRSL
jgi:hypothetical protein